MRCGSPSEQPGGAGGCGRQALYPSLAIAACPQNGRESVFVAAQVMPRHTRLDARAWLGMILGVALCAMAFAPSANPVAVYQTRLPVVLKNWPKPPGPLYLPFVTRPQPPPPVTADLSVSRVEIIQGITLSDAYTVHVANRPAMVRVFLNLSGAASQTGVFGKLTRYLGGAPQDMVLAGPITAFPSTDEGNLAETLNFALPPGWLEPGTAY